MQNSSFPPCLVRYFLETWRKAVDFCPAGQKLDEAGSRQNNSSKRQFQTSLAQLSMTAASSFGSNAKPTEYNLHW